MTQAVKALEPIINKSNIGKPVFFVLSEMTTNPTYEGRFFPPSTTIPSINIIQWWDDKRGQFINRTIQYIPTEQSIFVDEQSEMVQDINSHNTSRLRGVLKFEMGLMTVNQSESLKLQFLRLTPNNLDSPNPLPDRKVIFKENKPEENTTKWAQKDFELAEVIMKIKLMDIPTMKSYGKVLRMDINRSVSEIKYDMVSMAKKDPTAFMKGMENPLMQKMYYVLEAIDLGILRYDRSTSTLSWRNGNVILHAGQGKDGVEEFVKFANSDQTGAAIFVEIKNSVSPYLANEDVQEIKKTTDTGALVGSHAMKSKEETDNIKLVKSLFEKGIITQHRAWLKWGTDGRFHGNLEKLANHLDDNPDLKEKMFVLLNS